ncbi:MAG: hypothetical protein ACFFB0_05335 [Promethearchaeota archaeon]
MAKIKSVAIVLGIFLLIAIIHGIISDSFNVFVSWILIGIWLIYSFKVLKNIKQYREFNSPHNTAFFTIGPVFIGIFYSTWGNFTGILGENLLEGTGLYLSWWGILFGFPYLVYGSYSLYRCFKKYNVIYFGTKAINARTIGYLLSLIVIFYIIFYWIIFYAVIDFYDSILIPVNFYADLNLILILISTILIFIISGIFGTQRRLPPLTRDYIARRRNRLNHLTSPQRNSNSRKNSIITNGTTRSSRITPTTQRRSTQTSIKTTSRTVSRKKTSKPSIIPHRTISSRDFNKYKPRAGLLSVEDFKCIFCFHLPKLPEDKGRGIVLCPKCRYPAHADEFKDWMQNSNLCSRCNAIIPSNYRRNPKIISIKNYIIIYKSLLKKK